MLIAMLVVISIVLLVAVDDGKNEMVLNEYYKNEYTGYQSKNQDSFY